MKRLAAILAACFAAMCILSACGEKPVENNEQPVVSGTATVANPVVDSTADEIETLLGFGFGEVEGAENVRYSIIDDRIGQMQYTKDGAEITARISAENGFTDISGMYYTWESTEDCTIAGREGKAMRTKDGDNTVDLCLWYDVAPGLMYSVSAVAPDLDGFDITAIAAQVFAPTQGEAE